MLVLSCTLLTVVLYLESLSAIRQLDELCKSKEKNGANGLGEYNNHFCTLSIANLMTQIIHIQYSFGK